LLVLQTGAVCAQDAVMQNDFEHKINLYNVNGKPISNAPVETAGSPFFQEQWKAGTIRLFNGQAFDHLLLKIDLERQQVHFRKPDNNEYVIDAGAVQQVVLHDSVNQLPAADTLQCGFPAIDNQGTQNFYLILCSGRIVFLEAIRKSIHEEKDQLSGETRKEYRTYDDYYFFREAKMERIKRDRSYFLNAMKDKEEQISYFLQKNKTSFRSINDIRRLVAYYNGLP
jgi:hypothetical protein